MWLLFFGMLAVAPFALGQAKDYPNRNVKIYVPFTPGSGSDTAARFFGEQLTQALRQPFIVENRPGGSGALSVTAVKHAAPDGYSILLASNSPLSVNPIVMKDLTYDPIKDIKPLSGLTRGMSGFIVPVNSKFKTLADLIAAAKSSKEPMSAGTYSEGYRLALEWFASVAGVKFTNIPYKGGSQMFTDIMGNQLEWGIADLGGVAPLLVSGKIRVLAVSGEKRHANFPDVPTIVESGYPEYINYTWTSFYVRSDTPDDITNKLADALQKILTMPAAAEFAKKSWAELMPLPPAAMRKFQSDELDRFRRIAEAGSKPQ
jgi:tripartite-type tricarboxylate transporter receptor subunit TctC